MRSVLSRDQGCVVGGGEVRFRFQIAGWGSETWMTFFSWLHARLNYRLGLEMVGVRKWIGCW
jgi:hypothetical protein